MGFPGAGFSIMFTIVPIMFFAFFILFIVLLVTQISKRAKINKINNNSPILKVEAEVIAKRFDSRHNRNRTLNDNINSYSTYTIYYVTFQVESGDRMEFNVQDNEYGMLVEHDKGKLTFQGTRYLGFERFR